MFAQYNRLHLHVFDSNLTLVRRALKMIKPKHRYARSKRVGRHWWLRQMIQQHDDARALYAEVMC